jgi:hypothetical protein
MKKQIIKMLIKLNSKLNYYDYISLTPESHIHKDKTYSDGHDELVKVVRKTFLKFLAVSWAW